MTSPLQRLIQKLAASRFFTISLGIHIALIALLGSVVLFKASQKESSFLSVSSDEPFLPEQPALEEAQEQSKEFEESAPSKSEANAPSSQSVISTLSTMPSSWSTSASMDQISYGTNLSSYQGPSSLSGGTGGGGSASGTGKLRMGSVFGRQIQSDKFGVVFDVSFSTHGSIDAALKEIEKGFPNAIIVLAPGCGVAEKAKGEVVTGEAFTKNIDKYQFPNTRIYMGAFLPALLEKNDKFKKMFNRANHENRMFVLTLDQQGKNGAAMINGTQLAFDFLEKQGCDTIWWMADFKDKINEKSIEHEARSLKAKKIKVIQHDFDGGKELEDPTMKLISVETGGEIVIGTGKR